ncbi:MAG: LPS assembly lipoprotein LptE [Desulfatibacillaceae bacterium]
MTAIAAAVAAALLAQAGCGYRFAAMGPDMPVYVRMLENRTTESGIENLVTDGLQKEFARSGQFSEARRPEGAAVLSGEVTGVRESSAAKRVGGESTERNIRVTVRLALKGRDGVRIAGPLEFTERETYVVEAAREATLAHRERAVERLSRRIAQKARHELAARLAE